MVPDKKELLGINCREALSVKSGVYFYCAFCRESILVLR